MRASSAGSSTRSAPRLTASRRRSSTGAPRRGPRTARTRSPATWWAPRACTRSASGAAARSSATGRRSSPPPAPTSARSSPPSEGSRARSRRRSPPSRPRSSTDGSCRRRRSGARGRRTRSPAATPWWRASATPRSIWASSGSRAISLSDPPEPLEGLDDNAEIRATVARRQRGRVEALGDVGQRERGADLPGGLLDEVQVLHEEVELHLGRELSPRDQRAAHLEYAPGCRASAQHVEHEFEVEPGPPSHQERLARGRAVERDQQVRHELEDHRLAGLTDEDGTRQDRLEHRAPAVEHAALAADEDDPLAVRHHGARPADRSVQEREALRRDLTRQAL